MQDKRTPPIKNKFLFRRKSVDVRQDLGTPHVIKNSSIKYKFLRRRLYVRSTGTPQLYRLRNGNFIVFNIAIIRSWRSQFGKIPARDFPDNRCYMTRPKRSVGRVQRGKGA